MEKQLIPHEVKAAKIGPGIVEGKKELPQVEGKNMVKKLCRKLISLQSRKLISLSIENHTLKIMTCFVNIELLTKLKNVGRINNLDCQRAQIMFFSLAVYNQKRLSEWRKMMDLQQQLEQH